MCNRTKIKYLLAFIFIFICEHSYAISVEDILKTHGKSKVVSVLSQQFESRENTKLTIDFNGTLRQMHRPAQEYITANTIKKDLKRLGIKANQFNNLILKDLEDKHREKIWALEESKRLELKQAKEANELRLFGFEFDGWKSGMSITEMKQQAKQRQLSMSPGQSTYLSSYNEVILNSKPEQRHYAYRTTLMGKVTTVILSFTKDTKKLFQAKATFHLLQVKPEERKYFYESLYSQLSKKYGKAKNISRDDVNENASKSILGVFTSNIQESIAGSLQAWDLNTENIVTLSYKKNYHTMNSYELTYNNQQLSKLNKKEITHGIKKNNTQVFSIDGNRL